MKVVSKNCFKALVWLVVAMGLGFASAFADPLTVESSDDGHGLYSYTFSHGNDYLFAWGIESASSGISLKSYGIIETLQPPGWVSVIDADGWITWNYTNGLAVLYDPVTVYVRSSFTVPRPYYGEYVTSGFGKGSVYGGIFMLPDWHFYALGFEGFSFIGPNTNCSPTLALEKIGTNMVVSWPTAATGFTLQSSTNISDTTGWLTVTNLPVVLGHDTFVTNACLAGGQFFRALKLGPCD